MLHSSIKRVWQSTLAYQRLWNKSHLKKSVITQCFQAYKTEAFFKKYNNTYYKKHIVRMKYHENA